MTSTNKKKTTAKTPAKRKLGNTQPRQGHENDNYEEDDEVPEEELDEVDDLEETDEITEEDEVVEEKPATKKTTAAVASAGVTPLVNCRGLENHKCVIGGKLYQIEQDRDIKLPPDAATILSHARKVMKK